MFYVVYWWCGGLVSVVVWCGLDESDMVIYMFFDFFYDFVVLELYISGKIMELYYDKYYVIYVVGVNIVFE